MASISEATGWGSVGASLAVVLSTICITWLLARGDKTPPGPRSMRNLNPFGMLFFFASTSKEVVGKLHLIMWKWGNIYGNLFYFRVLNERFYVITDQEIGAKLYSHSFSNTFSSRGQNGIKYFIPKSLLGFTHTDSQWKKHRSLIVGAFAESYLKKYFSSIVKVGTKVCDGLDASTTSRPSELGMYTYTRSADTGQILVTDIVELFNRLTYEVLANTVLGSQWMSIMPSFGTKAETHAILATSNFLNADSFNINLTFDLMWLVDYMTPLPQFLWKILPFKHKAVAHSAMTRIRENALKQICGIRQSGEQGDSMMHFLVHHNQGLDNDEIVDELISLVMAGHETTANTLSFSLVSLAYKPDLQKKARDEVLQALDKSGGTYSYGILKDLPYIWQILRESLRLFPTVPINSRIADQAVQLGGYKIPKGSRVLINNIGICRSADIFDNPLEFSPERWDKSDSISNEKHLTNLKNFNDTRSFGGGQRFCVGKRFAEEEFVLLLAIFLSRFSISLPKLPAGQSRVPLTEIPTTAQVTMTFEDAFPLLLESQK